MLSEALETGLAEFRIGAKVREYRKRKKLSLAQLSAHTGLSVAMLSKIERGDIHPTLPTLLRIALAFGIGLETFFLDDEKRKVALTRRKARVKLPDTAENPSPTFLFESLNYPLSDRNFEAYLAEFPPGRPASEPHRHDGTELVYVLKGRLVVTIDDEDHLLDAGDAICFDSGATHGYRCVSAGTAEILVAIVP
jgi:quercetin dioxygenase-like cupin family protein/DNA-binding phage protein